MFITPYFGGCKYTNNFLFINNNIEFQQFVLLITSHLSVFFRKFGNHGQKMDHSAY